MSDSKSLPCGGLNLLWELTALRCFSDRISDAYRLQHGQEGLREDPRGLRSGQGRPVRVGVQAAPVGQRGKAPAKNSRRLPASAVSSSHRALLWAWSGAAGWETKRWVTLRGTGPVMLDSQLNVILLGVKSRGSSFYFQGYGNVVTASAAMKSGGVMDTVTF